MDREIIKSPEIKTRKIAQKNFIYRALAYIIRPFTTRLKYRYLLRKWSHHADPRSFDWDWSKNNFNRIAVVNLLLNKFENPFYLEIGCDSNYLFDSVPILNKTGVDPDTGGNVRKTSDDFFKINNIKFDVVFIDGLHTYEQVRKDVINSLQSIKDGGWIALHDMLPRNWIEHHIPIVSNNTWTGDIWKIAFELLETKNIEFKILKIDYGIGLIKVIDSKAELKDLRSELENKEFTYYYNNINRLPIIEWKDAQEWLRF